MATTVPGLPEVPIESASLAQGDADLPTAVELVARRVTPSFVAEPAPRRPDAQPPARSLRARASREKLADHLVPRIVEIRNRRRTIDEEDLRAHACWRGVRTRHFYESDNFQHYIPIGRRVVERFAVRVVQQLLPTGQYFEVYPGDELAQGADREAESVLAYLDYLLEGRIGIRRVIGQLVRSYLNYRRCVAKIDVRLTDATVRGVAGPERLREVWPHLRAVDPFSFYVWPETASGVDDAELIFEDVMMPWAEYDAAAQAGVCDAIERRDLTTPEWPYHLKARLALIGLVEPGVPATGQSSAAGYSGRQGSAADRPEPFVALSEAWFRADSRWMQTWLVWNAQPIPRVTRAHPTLYPRPPYRLAVARATPAEHYTHSLMQDVEPLNVLLNDQFNQSEEARSISAIPPVILNPDSVTRTDSIVFGPRKKWLMNNVADAQLLPIADTSQQSLRAIQFTLGLLQQAAASPPLLEGQTQRNMPRAGFAVQSLLALGMADIEDAAKTIEADVLTPGLKDLHRLALLFVPAAQLLSIPGTAALKARTLSVRDLYGSWNFRWVGSLQKQQEQVKAQQMMVMLQTASRIAPLLAEQGYAINWPVLFKRIWRETLGERGLEEVIMLLTDMAKTNPAAAAALQGILQGAQPGPGGAPPGGGNGQPGPPQGPGRAAAGQGDVNATMGRLMSAPTPGQMMAG